MSRKPENIDTSGTHVDGVDTFHRCQCVGCGAQAEVCRSCGRGECDGPENNEHTDTFTAEQIKALGAELRALWSRPWEDASPIEWITARLILQARAERDEWEAMCRGAEKRLSVERDAALARVRELEGMAPEVLDMAEEAEALESRIAALEADVERWQNKAGAERNRVKELEDALDAKSYLAAQNDEYFAQITALEAEIEQLMKTEEARAVAYGHWKQKEIDRLEAENAELRKRKAHIEFDTYARDMRIAANERLRVAFEKADNATCDCMPSAGCPESCEKCSWGDYPDSIRDHLRAALKGEGDE